MTATFASAARRLAGHATRMFGWTPDAFWHATPGELATILNPEDLGGEAPPLSRRELDSLLERDDAG